MRVWTRFPTIFLLLLSPWALAQGEKAPLIRASGEGAENCGRYFTPAEKVDLGEVPEFVFNGEPKYHALNGPGLLSSLRTEGKKEYILSAFDGSTSLEKLCSRDLANCFVVVKKELSNNRVTLKGADGRWFEVKATRSWSPFKKSTKYLLDFSKFKYLESPHETFISSIGKIKRLYKNELFSERSAEELGDYLTVKQLEKSANFEEASAESKVEFAKGIREANRLLAAKIMNREPLDRETLSRVNTFAHSGINPYNNPKRSGLAGIYRGSNDQFSLINGKNERIDLTHFQVYQEQSDGTVLNHFLPASKVPGAVDEWIRKVNLLPAKNPDPEKIFSLYKELVDIHPFPDGNGRTSRMMLNYLLLRSDLFPLDFPAHSLYFRPEDILRKYVQTFEKRADEFSRTSIIGASGRDFFKIRSFDSTTDIDALAAEVKDAFKLDKVKLEHLHGTSGYIFVGTYKGRFIQFESTRFGEELSDSLGAMVSRGINLIDEQTKMAAILNIPTPSHAIYPELLEQKSRYHLLYQFDYLLKKFIKEHGGPPGIAETKYIFHDAEVLSEQVLDSAPRKKSDREFFDAIMFTPKVRTGESVTTVENVAERVLEITSPEFKEKIRTAMVEKASAEMKRSYVEVFKAFDSPKFDQFMTEVALEALELCKKSGECSARQRTGIPDYFLALVIKNEAQKLGVEVETISRFVGREPGRLYFQRIQRGSLLIDDGAPGNHGMMPHALQNLFIYRQLGKERGQAFFKGLTGWVYERMFDANIAFVSVPSTRDITRRHYWTGVFKAGNRSRVSALGSIATETGRYSGFLRENQIELVSVVEKTQGLLNAGSTVHASYRGHEFTFEIDRDGIPEPGALDLVRTVKKQFDGIKPPETLPNQ